MRDNQNVNVIMAWTKASIDLDFKINAPFKFVDNGFQADCIGFLPDFGSPNGMILDGTLEPNFEVNYELEKHAKRCGIYLTFINLQMFSLYDEKLFKGALEDWGFYGAINKRPQWLPK